MLRSAWKGWLEIRTKNSGEQWWIYPMVESVKHHLTEQIQACPDAPSMVYLLHLPINNNHSSREIYQSHGAYGIGS